jgi:two-component system, NtrC family, sensor kinase
MHRLLQRQLKRHLGSHNPPMPEWENFLKAVDEAYCQFEEDHGLLERSLELSSTELLQSNAQLQELLNAVESQVAERTLELAQTNAELTATLADLRNTQVQLIQAEKMSSLGQLVAGIAHEVNNPVNFIHGNLVYLRSYSNSLLSIAKQAVEDYSEVSSELQELIDDTDFDYINHDLPKLLGSMEIGTHRIQQIVLSLRNFSRMDESEFKAVDLHDGIDSTLVMLDHRLKVNAVCSAIEIIKNYGNLPVIECYAGQINQVFMNILVNAIDAIEEKARTLSLKELEAISHRIEIHTLILDQQFAVIRFVDSGIGLKPAIQKKIFDPFFTTKPVGMGTGMGLSISYQIITERHGGTIECFSSVGKGTEFVIKIPIVQSRNHQQSTSFNVPQINNLLV